MISKKVLIEFFKISPIPSVVLLPDAPNFTIIEVNNAYLEATNSKREDLVGKAMFSAFPGDKNDPTADGAKEIAIASLTTVVKTKKSHKTPVLKYDIPIEGTSEFESKYWKPENIPLLNEDGELDMIIHTVMDVTESILTEKKIAEAKIIIDKSTEILQQTERISKLGRWEQDLKTGKMLWSDSNYLMIGYEPQEFEMTITKILEILHPDDIERRNAYFEQALKEKKDYKIEVRFITKSKSVINVLIRGVFIYDAEGNPKKIVGVLQDITDIKQAEEAKRKTQEELQKILDLSLDIICTSTAEGQFVSMNAACIEIFGYTPEEMIGKHFTEFIYQDDQQKSNEAQSKVISGIEITTFENTYLHKDGSLVHMIWSARWQELDKTMYGVGKDVTTIKKAEKQAQERLAFIETALENMPIGISINKIDDNKAIWMNKKFSEIYGWPKEVLLDIPAFFEKAVSDESYLEQLSVPLEDDSNNGNKEERLKWKDITITTQRGEQRNINAKNIPLNDQNLLISTVVDVTEKIKAQKAIEESNERFEYVNKATFDAIWDWDLANDSIYLGEGFEKIFGYKISGTEVSSMSWRKNIHPDDLQRIVESFYTLIKSTETNWIEEYRFKKEDGDYANVINKGIVVRDNDNRVIRIIGAMHDITKQKQEEFRLKLLESVVTNTTDSVLITEAEPFDLPGNRILYVNEAFTKMTGYTAEEVIGKTPRILQGPKTDKEELNKLGEALRRWESCEATLLNYKKNGKEFWINISITPVADEKGWFTHWIAIERDVTKQKEEEERLKLLETVIINTNDAVVIKEANPSSELGREILYINESFTRMSGYTESEIVGKTHSLLQGPNSDAIELTKFYKALDEQKPTEITIINYKKNGEEFWVNLALNPVFNDKGEHTHWVSIERDVTERKKQEQNLAEVNQKLLDTLESIQDGFYTLDNNWNVSYWNNVVADISGKSHQEMIGRNIWDVFGGQISKIMYSKFHEAKERNKPVFLEVFSKTNKNWFEINAFPSSLGLTVYFKDISERKQIESKLKKMNRNLEAHIKKLAISNEELEQFAYVASHDLQEPLRMVTGFLTQIEKKYEDVLDEKGKKYIFFAVDGAKRMRQIILDLLEFSRIGKKENKLEEINLTGILDEVVLLYRKQIEEKNAKINYVNLPTIRTYLTPIKQIFQNLISNSLKYSKSNTYPIVTITSEETALEWEFIVQDNGIGINSEYFEKIFIIFQRLHNKDEYSGTGMGLAITKKIIDNLGGRIWLESEEGVGTAFHFTIPKKQTKRS